MTSERKVTTIYFSDEEYEVIKTNALREGLTVHKIVQKACDAYIWAASGACAGSDVESASSQITVPAHVLKIVKKAAAEKRISVTSLCSAWLSYLPGYISRIKK